MPIKPISPNDLPTPVPECPEEVVKIVNSLIVERWTGYCAPMSTTRIEERYLGIPATDHRFIEIPRRLPCTVECIIQAYRHEGWKVIWTGNILEFYKK